MRAAPRDRAPNPADRTEAWPAASPGQILYVHPAGHLNDAVVPAGALSCLNAVDLPKLGRYAFEVTEGEILAASVVAVDFHWGISLPVLERLLGHVRRVHPTVPIVAGGISAGHYAAELTHSGLVDFAIRGDSEDAFRALTASLAAGRSPVAIPNVIDRTGPLAPPRRMSADAFDATDPLTAGWFPTHERLRRWDARAFPAGPTIPVARGCPLRCPACYGSFADTYGGGWLLRSPRSTAALVARAASMAARNLRLVLGKPGDDAISALAAALAAAGPFRFEGGVGLFLCTPPTPTALDDLLAAFDKGIVISAVAPAEHDPPPSASHLAYELDGWREVARRAAAAGGRLKLDLWASTASARDDLRAALGGERPWLGVSLSAVWHLTRPTDWERPPLESLRAAVDPLWTFYAARLLSPALADLLEPFRFLDELPEPPETVAKRPAGLLTQWHEVIMSQWGTHRLPMLPGLVFSAVPLRLAHTVMARARAGVRFEGDVGYAAHGDARTLETGAVPLVVTADHAAVRLSSLAPLPEAADGFALVPHAPDGRGLEPQWIREVQELGLVVIAAPSAIAGPAHLRVTLRMQEAAVALLDEGGVPRRRGRVHLDYMAPPHDDRRRVETGRE